MGGRRGRRPQNSIVSHPPVHLFTRGMRKNCPKNRGGELQDTLIADDKLLSATTFFDYLCQYVADTHFVFFEIINICVFQPKLPLADISSVHERGIVTIAFDFIAGKNPVAYYITPYRDPYKDITAGWLQLLKVHIEGIFRITGKRLDNQRIPTFASNGS